VKKSLWLLALLAGPGFAQDILLAPGRSITILDAADPSVRVVLSAPKNAPLNLSAILVTDPKESVYSIVTRLQLNGAGCCRAAGGCSSPSRVSERSKPSATSRSAAVMPRERRRSSCATPTR
jgi:hypothetical protein